MSTVCPLPAGPAPAGLATSLDAECMTSLITRHLLADTTLTDCRPIYVRYKGLDGALVGWRVVTETEGKPLDSFVTARSAAPWRLRSEAEALRARARRVHRRLQPMVLLEKEQLLLLSFPLDRSLRHARHVLRASRLRDLLLRECPEIVGEGLRIAKRLCHAEIVRYKPQRRIVLRWSLVMEDENADTIEQRVVYVRVHATPIGERAAQSLRHAADAGVRCPSILAIAEGGLAVESEIPGETVAEMTPTQATAAGQLLATMHRAKVPAGLGVRTVINEMDAVLQACLDLAGLDPALGARADAIANDLSSWTPLSPTPRLLHGDFHQGQLLFDHSDTGLVDFDRTAAGQPAFDLATFFAHQIGQDPERAGSVTAALEDAYDRELGLPPRRTLAWYRACALLRFAMTPFRTLQPDWPRAAHELLEQAAASLSPVTR